MDVLAADTRYHDFLCNHMLANRPCVLDAPWMNEWQCVKDWRATDGKPNLDFFRERFGDAQVPVVECSASSMYGSRQHDSMTMAAYCDYCERRDSQRPCEDVLLYLKDWHFQRTPLHADVLGSFSWSANVCGRKLWLVVPAGNERFFYANDHLGTGGGELVSDIRSMRHAFERAGVVELTQLPGQVVFVPSDWHHQVHNLEDTISVNHNWINATLIDHNWRYVYKKLCDVREEIKDCVDVMGEQWYDEQCQLIMRADLRIDIAKFLRFIGLIAKRRLAAYQARLPDTPPSVEPRCERHSRLAECRLSADCRERLRVEMAADCSCTDVWRLCDNCDVKMLVYDVRACHEVLDEVVDVARKYCSTLDVREWEQLAHQLTQFFTAE